MYLMCSSVLIATNVLRYEQCGWQSEKASWYKMLYPIEKLSHEQNASIAYDRVL
jgi:hypothetical protein